MNKIYFTIGEISKIKGLTIKALRFYDRIGLLKPAYTDPESHYRYYHINQFVYLDIIKAARIMDISPNDLIPFFKEKSSKELLAFLNKHKDNIRRRIEDLEKIIRGIDEVNISLHSAETASKDDKVYSRLLPDRFAVTIPFDERKSEEDIVMDFSKLYLKVNSSGLIHTYQEGLLFSKNRKEEFYPEYLCCFIADGENDSSSCLVPSGNYFCVCYTRDKAEQQQKVLWDYLKNNGLNPVGLVQVGLLTDLLAEETEYIELQARV
jgi:MerR family transcriptional regulator, activator of bmr gene